MHSLTHWKAVLCTLPPEGGAVYLSAARRAACTPKPPRACLKSGVPEGHAKSLCLYKWLSRGRVRSASLQSKILRTIEHYVFLSGRSSLMLCLYRAMDTCFYFLVKFLFGPVDEHTHTSPLRPINYLIALEISIS